MTTRAELRFDIRKDRDSTREIFETTTGRRVLISGEPCRDLPLDSAYTLAAYMSSASMVFVVEILH
ncbi:hypothetical protein [Neorhizobium galegae]|uniref:hypothetical protein n=1 Tax=Neorhizobium galegae TaxID=399 RepID=UPI00062111D6|nr:hypothetical protein [Neorhizobium galegae]KAB1121963.1 hypothetical protein F4V90_22445 [Neorhizobium galegae]MCQ1809404.1 hypothetical protein [Neorhizobium galegae]CDZ63597.1 Hypothetical protein NGAL_HAMBI2566_56380 [Neorhizobium galegae bv. orientalis]CDZ68020.1 Hypothetical protein NGAL_HAMBI2605_63030 [Neorhizobium galegae bv. orientalis]